MSPVVLKTALSWSSGKDAAWSLFTLRQDPRFEVEVLATTFNQAFDRVAMHGVRRELVQQQADAVGLPLRQISLPWPCSNQQYQRIMCAELDELEMIGFQIMAFGDLFLDDVRAYRERLFGQRRIQTVYPVWGKSTSELAREMIQSGLKAHVTCLDPKLLPREFAGRSFDLEFLTDLPEGVDPCGERGEFHTFCWDGPMFRRSLAVEVGEVVERDGFVFCDIQSLPG